MTAVKLPRILIAAGASGSGKTSVVCGLLSALLARGKNPTAFKCGPDYIDPMFHSEIIGAKSRNLDLYFMRSDTVRYLLCKNGADSGVAVMEGVMGYYDGLGGRSTQASSYHLAKVTETPVVLVMNAKGMSLSAGAYVKGFSQFRDDSGIKGVILNNLSPAMLPMMKDIIEGETGIPVFGCLPTLPDCRLESRHLGLITAAEVKDLKEKTEKLGQALEEYVDIDGLLRLAESAPPLHIRGKSPGQTPDQNRSLNAQPEFFSEVEKPAKSIPIGIARDKAFCFYYEDSLDLLREAGAELVPFSPLADESIPKGVKGLILGGGYPELYGKELSENKTMLADIKQAVEGGMPCIAECGGFMYLHRQMEDREGNLYDMAGLVPGICRPQGRLKRFGYAEFTANRDTVLCGEGMSIRGHEFHYWDSDCCGDAFSAEKPVSQKSWDCIYTYKNMAAGFPHFHLYSNPSFAERFTAYCADMDRDYGTI